MHLNAINQLDGPKPWKLSFSFGRALQDEALRKWQEKHENLHAGQLAFGHRAKVRQSRRAGLSTRKRWKAGWPHEA
jgi:fructose-bisphosphate aldolase class I